MPLGARERAALVRLEQRQRLMIRDRLRDYAVTAWAGMGSWRDADVDRFVERLLPRVQSGRARVAQMTDAYIARMIETDPAGVADVSAPRGVPDDVVYRRPALTVYSALSDGVPIAQAVALAQRRLERLVADDLMLAMRAQATHALSLMDGGLGGFRRTLTGRENCSLCAIASTQRYTRGSLLPIHPGCDCGVEPLDPDRYYPQVIDQALLDSVHAQVEALTGNASDRGARDAGLGTLAEDGLSEYMRHIAVREHGEFGAVLTWAHQAFTGPSDVPH